MINTVNWRRFYFYCLVVGFIFLLGLYSALAFRVFFANSELWSVNLAYNFWHELTSPWATSRLGFYLPLQFIQLWTDDPVTNLYLVRGVMLIWTVFIVCSIGRLLKGFYNDSHDRWSWAFILSLILLFSHTTFLNQGFRIRSDFVATFLVFCSLHYFLFDLKKVIWKDFIFFFLPLVATPKAFFFLIAFLLFKPWQRIWLAHQSRWFLSLGGLILAAVLSYFYRDSILYFERIFTAPMGTADYFSKIAFFHVFKSIRWNPYFYLLLGYAIYDLKKQVQGGHFQPQDPWSKYLQFTFFLTVLLLLMPEKVPYFIGSLVPFWSVWLQKPILDWFENWKLKKMGIGFLGLFLLVYQASDWSVKNWIENSNRFQIHNIGVMAKYMMDNKIENYFDGVGIFPAKDKYRIFVGPNSLESANAAEHLISKSIPDLLLITPDLVQTEAKYFKQLRENYVLITSHLHVRATSFQKMARNEIQQWFDQAFERGGGNQMVITEIVTRQNGEVEGVERINLTLDQLLRKYSDIMNTRAKRDQKTVEVSKVCLFPEMKVSMHGSLNDMFKFDVEF